MKQKQETTDAQVKAVFAIPDDGVPAKPTANNFHMHLGWLCGQNKLNVPKDTPNTWDGWNPLMLKYANYLHQTRQQLNLMEIAKDCLGIPPRHLHWFKQAAESFDRWERAQHAARQSKLDADALLEEHR